ncbi:hypothetical protein D3C87_1572160 [compost metagenome]
MGDQRPDDRSHRQLRVDRPQMPRSHAALHQACQHRHRPVEHVAAIDVGHAGNIHALAQEQARDRQLGRVAQQARNGLEQHGDGQARIALEGGELGQGAAGDRRHRALDDALDQRLLGGEIEIDRALGYPGAPGDVFHLGAGKALLGEHRHGGVEQFVRPRFGPSAEFLFALHATHYN